MPDIRFIAIDLDGTLMGRFDEFPLYAVFRQNMEEWQRTNNTVWAVCTGRSLSSCRTYMAPMQMMGITPDFVIVRHAYTYSVTRHSYRPHFIWNLRIRHMTWKKQLRIRHAIDEFDEMIFRFARKATVVRRTKERLWVRFDTEETAAAVADMLKDKLNECSNLRLFKFLREIDIRFVPFAKGLAISELTRHLNIGPGGILAIGDGYNDLSMFDPHVAAHVGCPANAAPEVMQMIHDSGGHIAKGRSLAGVIEILDAYRTGSVSSALPEGFRDPRSAENPNSKEMHHHHDPRHLVLKVMAGLLGFYVVLTVFANFNIIPVVSKPIMWPFRQALKLAVKLMNMLGQ
jgi:HAD superfamily hydrolase (TIGR01484 family)